MSYCHWKGYGSLLRVICLRRQGKGHCISYHWLRRHWKKSLYHWKFSFLDPRIGGTNTRHDIDQV